MPERSKKPAEQQAVQPPHNLDAEEQVLGAMMLYEPAIDTAAEIVSAGDFYRASHGTIFATILELRNTGGKTVDVVTVADALEASGRLAEIPEGKARLQEIATLVPAAGPVAHHAAIVRELAQLRSLAILGDTIHRAAMSRAAATPELIEQAETMIFDVARGRAGGDFVPLSVTVSETVERLEALHAGDRDIVGVPTGFGPLDALTSGLQPGNLVIVAARPSMGKSGLAVAFASHVALRLEQPVAFFTLEMSRYEITQRLISGEALVESQKLRNGRMSNDEWRNVMNLSGRLAQAPLFIDDNRLATPTEIRSKCRRLKMRHPNLALVIVDYLQLMTRSVENRVNEVAQISRALKILAGELELPVVALSQLSRALETRHDKRPILSDLRDSGAIEQDADLVLFIYRDEVYNPEDTDQHGVAELNLAKHRNGPTDTVKVAFVKRYARFSDLPRPGAGDVQ